MPSTEIEKFQTLLSINNAIIHQRSRESLFREITALLEPLFQFDRISVVLNRPGKLAWDYFSPAIGVLIFAGLTAWDTQKIKEMYDANDDGTVSGRKTVMGALTLYLDFINLFLFMLRFLGDRR